MDKVSMIGIDLAKNSFQLHVSMATENCTLLTIEISHFERAVVPPDAVFWGYGLGRAVGNRVGAATAKSLAATTRLSTAGGCHRLLSPFWPAITRRLFSCVDPSRTAAGSGDPSSGRSSPRMLTMWQWCTRRSMRAAAITSSPSTPPPVLETLVRGQHGRGPLVAGVADLEEEHGAVLVDRRVADLVDHEQSRVRQHAQPPRQVAGRLGLGEGLDQSRERAVIDAPSGFGRRDRQADRQVSLPDPGGPSRITFSRSPGSRARAGSRSARA